MKAQDFEAETPPWFDTGKWRTWAESKGISISKGERHNRTDGEVHYILKYNLEIFDLHANDWEWRSGWQEAIDWVETKTDSNQR